MNNPTPHTGLYLLIAVVIAVVFGVVSLGFLPRPFVWLGLVCGGLLIWLTVVARGEGVKAVFFNLAVLFLALTGAEAYLASAKHNPPVHFEGDYTQRYFDKSGDRDLGYVPFPDTQVDSRKYHNNKLVYDVTYTIDRHGLRVAPPVSAQAESRCILFFGGSFTFGEGVEDDETAAYRVGLKLHGQYRVHNFGFHGYGPHQMLSALEGGMVESIADCDVRLAVYQALVTHVRRSAGVSLWDLQGPRYVLTDNGVHRDGELFEYYHLPLPVIRQLNKSLLFRKVSEWLYAGKDDIGQREVDIFVSIIEQSRAAIREFSPQAQFHVVLWQAASEADKAIHQRIVSGLEERDIAFTAITDILPDIDSEQGNEKYRIANDGHPNALFHDALSTYIVDNILQEPAAAPRVNQTAASPK